MIKAREDQVMILNIVPIVLFPTKNNICYCEIIIILLLQILISFHIFDMICISYLKLSYYLNIDDSNRIHEKKPTKRHMHTNTFDTNRD